jgi:hypothetical protein
LLLGHRHDDTNPHPIILPSAAGRHHLKTDLIDAALTDAIRRHRKHTRAGNSPVVKPGRHIAVGVG